MEENNENLIAEFTSDELRWRRQHSSICLRAP